MPDNAKTIVISGAGSGIGLATARRFAAGGWNVAGFGRREAQLDAFKAEIERAGAGCMTNIADTRDEDAVGRLLADAAARFGGINAVFANAGFTIVSPIAETSAKDFSAQIETNLTGAFIFIKAAIPHLKKSKGIVLVNTSISSRVAFPGWGAYSASKAGLSQLARVLREEMRSFGVRVTEIVPGATATDVWSKIAPGLDKSRMVAPETVADAVFAAATMPPEASVDEIVITPSKGSV